MKKVLSILFWLCLLQVGMGQSVPTFSKLLLDSNHAGGGININVIGDTIYLAMFNHDTSNSYQYLNFLSINNQGQEVKRKKLKKPRYYISSDPKGLKMLADGSLMCSGNWGPNDSAGASGIAIHINPVTLDTISIKTYNRGVLSDFFGFDQLSDGNYLFCGEDGDGTQTGIGYAWITKADSAGNVIWQKIMAHDTYNEAYYPSAFPGGFYQYWHSYHYNTVNDNAKSAIFVDKYDNDGNLKWRDTFGIVGNENLAGPFTALNDGGGLLVVNVLDTLDPHDGLLNLPTVMYRFDSNGRILREKYFPQIPAYMILNSVIEDRKGELVFAGGGVANASPANPNGITGGLIMKLDSLCNLVFFKVIRYDSTISDRLFDITETADGGYAAVGNAFHAVGNLNVQAAWLVKVDSNGCLNGDCPALHTAIEEVAPESDRFLLFPNPAASQFTIAVTETEYFKGYKDLQFRLYDLSGRLVMNEALQNQTTTFPVTDYTVGVYLWQISEGDRKISTGKLAVVR